MEALSAVARRAQLRAQQAEEEKARPKPKASHPRKRARAQTSKKSSLFHWVDAQCVKVTVEDHACLVVGLHARETFPFYGCGFLALLEGSCAMHGYHFPRHRLVPISAPANQSAAVIEAVSPLPWHSDECGAPPLASLQAAVDTLKVKANYHCIFALIENRVSRVDEFERFFGGIWQGLWGPRNKISEAKTVYHVPNLSPLPTLVEPSVPQMTLHEDWYTTAEKLLSDMADPPWQAMIVGQKGVGKSSLCAFLANTMVSEWRKTKERRLFLLDADLVHPLHGLPQQIHLIDVDDACRFGTDLTLAHRHSKVTTFAFRYSSVEEDPYRFVEILLAAAARAAKEGAFLLINTPGPVSAMDQTVLQTCHHCLQPRYTIHVTAEDSNDPVHPILLPSPAWWNTPPPFMVSKFPQQPQVKNDALFCRNDASRRQASIGKWAFVPTEHLLFTAYFGQLHQSGTLFDQMPFAVATRDRPAVFCLDLPLPLRQYSTVQYFSVLGCLPPMEDMFNGGEQIEHTMVHVLRHSDIDDCYEIESSHFVLETRDEVFLLHPPLSPLTLQEMARGIRLTLCVGNAALPTAVSMIGLQKEDWQSLPFFDLALTEEKTIRDRRRTKKSDVEEPLEQPFLMPKVDMASTHD